MGREGANLMRVFFAVFTDNVLSAIQCMVNHKLFGLARNRVTLSTVGTRALPFLL